ncbi:MAG: hypothetical protein AAF624_00435, partial [Bacteroidota bacterium]
RVLEGHSTGLEHEWENMVGSIKTCLCARTHSGGMHSRGKKKTARKPKLRAVLASRGDWI